MPTLILAHDLGTTGDKATLFSAEGSLLCSAFEPYETFYPRAGWAEQDPAEYWRAFCASTSALPGLVGCGGTGLPGVPTCLVQGRHGQPG